MRRVVVTGLGMVCSLGQNVAECWQALSEGRSGITPLQMDCSALRFKNGAEVRGFDAEKHFPGGKADMLDRFAQFAVAAAREAVSQSGLKFSFGTGARTAVYLGSCVGGQGAQDVGFDELYRRGRNRVHPMTIPKTMANAGASHVCMEFGITGPAMVISTACSSSNHAIGQAFWAVRSGQVDA